MIECDTPSCRTMVNDSARGKRMDGTMRRNITCGRCVRLAKEARLIAKSKAPIEPKTRSTNRFRVSRGVFIRDCTNGSTQYIKIGTVDKMGIIHLFKESI